MTDRVKVQNSFESQQKKYGGTGNPDINKWEWERNIQKDLIASHLSHYSRLYYMSVSLNEHPEKTRLRLLTKLVLPNGPVPEEIKEDYLNKYILPTD